MHTSARSVRHASQRFLPRNQRWHVHHHSNCTHHQLYNSWISLWIRYSTAFLIRACWLCSFHCFRAPAFVPGGSYITDFAITSPEEDFWITHSVRNVWHVDIHMKCAQDVKNCHPFRSFGDLNVCDRVKETSSKTMGFREFIVMFWNYICQPFGVCYVFCITITGLQLLFSFVKSCKLSSKSLNCCPHVKLCQMIHRSGYALRHTCWWNNWMSECSAEMNSRIQTSYSKYELLFEDCKKLLSKWLDIGEPHGFASQS